MSRSACGWAPVGRASTGTSQASASMQASPKVSQSDGQMTAFAALTHSGTSSGATLPRVSSCASPAASSRARSTRLVARAGS